MKWLGDEGRMERVIPLFHLSEAQCHVVIKKVPSLENEVSKHLVNDLAHLFCVQTRSRWVDGLVAGDGDVLI